KRDAGMYVFREARRIPFLFDREGADNTETWENSHQIWCGILFVGNEDKLDEAKKMINIELNDNQSIRCCFVETRVVKEGKLDMRSDVFVNKATFVSPDYSGERLVNIRQ
nr:hypothetical protein [Lachnospiraceae bacterium]